MMELIEVISPVGGETIKEEEGASRVSNLNGKTICETWNEDFKGDYMFPYLSGTVEGTVS